MENIIKISLFKCKPCFGFFLQGAVKAVAIANAVLAIVLILLLSVHWRKESVNEEMIAKLANKPFLLYVQTIVWIEYIFGQVFMFFSSILLFKGAQNRNIFFCKIWLYSSTAFLSLSVVAYSFHIYFVILESDIAVATVFSVAMIICSLYMLYVVRAFIREMESLGNFNNALRGLTDEEIEAFEKGNPFNADGENKATGSAHQHNEAATLPYDKKTFEISSEDLKIDNSILLDEGQYGQVYKTSLNINNCVTTVAVKTFKTSTDVNYFKAMLTELKIMSSLGEHDHIISLIGACTSEIRKRKLYIVVEYCPNGNLLNHIRRNRTGFVSFVRMGKFLDPKTEGYANLHVQMDALGTNDLIKWSYEISLGMEYLASKKVIHGDLSARNMLLTADRRIKITDFGLSKQLYHCSIYEKHQNTPLPWRWLAIESLKDCHFSTSSDVWAYGVTLWEIFTLGEMPYPGFSWSTEFVHYLERGMRMMCPYYATAEVYDVLVKCWDSDSEKRPRFSEISSRFQSMLMELRKLRIRILGNYQTFKSSAQNKS